MKRPWTRVEVEVLTSMAKEGHATWKIATFLPGRSRDSVSSYAGAHGIKMGRQTPLFTPEEDDTITSLVKQGLSWAKIASAVDKPNSSVRSAARRLGLKKEWCTSYAPIKRKPKLAKKQCLQCRKWFIPSNKVYYVCQSCKSMKSWQEENWAL